MSLAYIGKFLTIYKMYAADQEIPLWPTVATLKSTLDLNKSTMISFYL